MELLLLAYYYGEDSEGFMTYYDIIETPLGNAYVSGNEAALTGWHFEGQRYFDGVPADWQLRPEEPVLRAARRQTERYFAGGLREFDLPIEPAGTAFQRAVWEALSATPYGEHTTYSQLAALIDRPRAVRAVGTAVGRNPLCVVVPCHRVLGADGGLAGYVAGLERKRWLLDLEAAHEASLFEK
ncbi:MAG TPA: methylated-DNA--[protein]-cysteine S-methyltransferase [Candidatus Saccharimonadia bacterium]|nr:methylated-DNA--[protein]-cysteine S-methyltransferase [Candidatus Saccharimonadia bacterium]